MPTNSNNEGNQGTDGIFQKVHVICNAYRDKAFPDKSEEYVHELLCGNFALPSDTTDADDLEKALLRYHTQQGHVFEDTKELLTVITEGKMSLVRVKLTLETTDLGTVELFDAVRLVVNNVLKAQTFSTENEGPILEAFQDSFPNRTLKDLEELSYYARIDTVIEAFYKLNPRGGLQSAISACYKACPDTSFTQETQRPEYIGEAYVQYLLEKWTEKTDAQYIMGLGNFIATGRYIEYGKTEEGMNLFDQPSHHVAYDIFHTMLLYESKTQKGGHGQAGADGAGAGPGAPGTDGDGPGNGEEDDDGAGTAPV